MGVGASAGGLDALKRLFAALPANPGAAFVVVQHLDPDHVSLLADLLGRVTDLPVQQAEDGTPVAADRVYVLPPGRELTLELGTLRLSDPLGPRGRRMPIDRFLESLAADAGDLAVAVILSGNGHDGALGVREIKARGGMVLVEDPERAEYAGMPRSALASGQADDCLPIEALADALLRYLRHPGLVVAPRDAAPADDDALAAIIAQVRVATGIDIGCFREDLIRHRMSRRMAITAMEDIGAYMARCRDSEREVRRLVHDLLAHGARLFPSPEVFELLQQRVWPGLLAGADPADTLRLWVPGCATGESAYALAMMLGEAVRVAQRANPLQIFATDLDRTALDRARAGRYRTAAAAVVPPAYRARYLHEDEVGVSVHKALKDAVLVGEHHFVSDPPFSRLHLICCSRLLERLTSAARAQMLRAFHFALREGGYLILGAGESIGRFDTLFEPVAPPWPVFRRRPQSSQRSVSSGARASRDWAHARETRPGEAGQQGLPQWIERELLRQAAPVAALVDENWNILYLHGDTARYLEVSSGTPTNGLIHLARRDLRLGLRSALKAAAREQELAVVRGLGAVADKGPTTQIWAWPVDEPIGSFLVCFMDDRAGLAQPLTPPGVPTLVGQLEFELRATREDLQGAIEEAEGANEALRSANEEVLSMNEELQSSNEELETSKEELQSLNEELTTVNAQLVERIAQQEAVNSDLANLLSSTDIATIFLDGELRVRRFTPRAVQVFALIESDIGRSISDVAQRYSDGDLRAQCARVMASGTPFEEEVKSRAGDWFTLRILPYRATDDSVDGVVLTFTDVSKLKAAHAEAQRRASQMRIVADALPVLIAQLDDGLRFRFINAAYREWFGQPFAAMLDQPLEHLIGESTARAMRASVEACAGGEISEADVELTHCRLGSRDVRATWVAERDGEGRVLGYYSLIHDVTEARRAERALAESRRQMQAFIEQAPVSMAMLDREMCYLSVSRQWIDDFLPGATNVIGRSHLDVLPDLKPEWCRAYQDALDGEAVSNDDDTWERADGSRRRLRWTVQPWRGAQGRIGGVIMSIVDITRYKQIEAALRASQRDLTRAQAVGSIGSWRLNVQRNELAWSPECHRIFGVPPGRQLTYESFMDTVHPTDRAYVDACWQRALAGAPYDIEHRLLVDGRVKWVREKAELEFDDNGDLRGGFGITQDITLQRETEIELKAANDRLEAVASEREAHLVELSNALSQAEVRERDRLYEVVHDHIQPLLVAARLGLSSIGSDTPPERALGVIGEVRRQITQLIQTARTLSVELSPPQIRDGGLVPALRSLVRWVRANHGLDVSFDSGSAVEPTSLTIRLLCFKAVRELLMNVVKYAGVETAALVVQGADEGRLSVVVSDDGVGMQHASEPVGTGLANIARRLEMVGGRLTISSREGRGVRASIDVPLDLSTDGGTRQREP
ncbi:MAG: PAS domain-containing protein [Rhodocyclaceae bacterium]|nr:PAS domain-containing protein [Rhodocyclaceae bacterium]